MSENDGTRIDDPVYEMFWNCEYCGTKKLLGKTHRHCPACGAAQNPEARYFPSEDEKIAVADHVYFGADRVCSSCETANSAKASFCGGCGAPLNESKEAQAVEENSIKPKPLPNKHETTRSTPWKYIILGILAVIIGAVLLNKTLASTKEFSVLGHEWKYSIGIDQFGPRQRSSWCKELPPGAYSVSRKREVYKTKKVQDGESCTSKNVDNRDGTFRKKKTCRPKYRSENIYANKCYYSINTWHEVRKVVHAEKNLNPTWPTPEIRSCGTTSLGCQRLGTRATTYTVHLQQKGAEPTSCNFSEDRWRSFLPNQRYSAKVGAFSGNIDCDSLAPRK